MSMQTETTQIEILTSQGKPFCNISWKVSGTYCDTGWILHNFPVTDTYANLFNPQAELFWQVDESGRLITSCVTESSIL